MIPDHLRSLHIVIVWLDFALLAFLIGGALLWRKSLARALGRIRSREFYLLLGLTGVHFFLIKPLLPHNIWHEQHAVGLLTGIGYDLYAGGLDTLHGPSYANILSLLGKLFFGKVAVFSLNYLVSIVGIILFFLWVRLKSGDGELALAASAMLLFLPVRMRLSTSESMYVLAECLLFASLLLTSVFSKTKDRRHLLLVIAAALLLMYARAEMLLLGPLILAAYFFIAAPKLLRGLFKRPEIFVGALLAVPRAAELVLGADPRIAQATPPSGFSQFAELGLRGTNAFFNPEYTPVLYMALFVVGAAHLFRKERRFSLFLHGSWILLTYFYAIHLSCVSLKIRTALPTQFIFVLFAAYGLMFLGRRFKKAGGGIRLAGLAAVLLAAPLACRGFLGTLYTKQQEFLFLSRIAKRLPAESAVVYLSEEDDPGIQQNRRYQKALLSPAALGLDKAPTALGIRRLLESLGRFEFKDIYYYEGAPCFTRPWLTGRIGPEPGEGYLNPFCASMHERFRLEAVGTETVTKNSLSWDAIEGEARTIGLYRVEWRRRPSRGGLPSPWAFFTPEQVARRFLVHAKPRRAQAFLERQVEHSPRDAGLRVLLARAALANGDPKLASASLERAEVLGPNAEQRGAAALLYQQMRDYPKALAKFDSLVFEFPDTPRWLADRGVLKAVLDRKEEAIADLEAAVALEGASLSAHVSLGGLYSGSGRKFEALAVYDRALSARPRPGERRLYKMIRKERRNLAAGSGARRPTSP